MTRPAAVQGAWTRRSVAFADGPRFETQHVIWLQAGACYADLRVPFHSAAQDRCFAGRSGWAGAGYRWTHRLDLEAHEADDVGHLDMAGDELIERGTFPTVDGPVAYEEVWVPVSQMTQPALALEAENACLVRVGDHAVTVVDERAEGGTFRAAHRRFDGSVWRTMMSIGEGDGSALPDPTNPPDGWAVAYSRTFEGATA
ncbi:MAG: hypothetical protein ACYDH6_10995 [Acidimicrobiales bacterium]